MLSGAGIRDHYRRSANRDMRFDIQSEITFFWSEDEK